MLEVHKPGQAKLKRETIRDKQPNDAINQLINIFNVLGPPRVKIREPIIVITMIGRTPIIVTRQEVQFSEFIQTRFVSYMQRIP